MTKWRPNGWKNPHKDYFGKREMSIQQDYETSQHYAFEAGADAMLKKIRELNTSTVPSSEFRDGKFRTGKWVFIPDGDTND